MLDLNEELRQLRKISGNHTLIYVEVPGIKNLADGYRNDPLRYFQNAHTYSFSLKTLQNLFSSHHFEMIHGNELIKAVFQVGLMRKVPIHNDYESTLRYLKKAETARKFYSLSYARLKVIFKAIAEKILN